MIDRSVTIAATPIATQMKKNSNLRQDARSSRATILRTKLIVGIRDPWSGIRPLRGLPSAPGASSATRHGRLEARWT